MELIKYNETYSKDSEYYILGENILKYFIHTHLLFTEYFIEYWTYFCLLKDSFKSLFAGSKKIL